MQHIGCPTHQSGHTLDLIITEEEDTLCVSDLMGKFYISNHSFVHSEIRVNKLQVVRRTKRTKGMRNVEQKKNQERDRGDRGDD